MSHTRPAVVAPRLQPERHLGVDLARGVAIIAMIIAHVKHWAGEQPDPLQSVLNQVNNLASPLFGLLMGVALGIVVARGETTSSVLWRNVVRGLVLVLVGLVLERLGTFVAIVLPHLGITLIVGTVLAMLPLRLVGSLAAVGLLGAPAANDALRTFFAHHPVTDPVLARLVEWVVLSPSYRLTNLLPLFLLGVVLGRVGLTRRAVMVTGGIGAISYVLFISLWATGHTMEHSGDLIDSLGDVGLSLSALAVCLVAGDLVVGPARLLLQPVAAIGTVALSVYVLHVVLIAVVMRVWGAEAYQRWAPAAALVLVPTLLAAWAWWRWVGKGPLEVLLAMVSGRYRPG